jgi:O-antigen/teichoic acid export membrane protein
VRLPRRKLEEGRHSVNVQRAEGTRKAGRSIGLYAAGSLSAGIVGFLSLPVFTRIFSPEDFGVIGLFTAGVGLLTPTISLVGFVFILFDRASKDGSSGVAVATVLISTSISAVLLSVLGTLVVVGILGSLPTMPFALATVTAWANVWVAVRLHTYQADQQPGRFFLLSAIPPISAFVVTVLIATRIDDWRARILALAAVAVAAACWSAWSLAKRDRLSLADAIARVPDVIRFGAPLVVTSAAAWIVGFTDRFIVAERIGLSDAGIYTVAYALGLGVSSAHDGVARYFVSRLPQSLEAEDGARSAARFAYRYTAVAIGTVPLLIPVALLSLNLLAAEEFAEASTLLLWLIPAQTFAGVARVYAGYLYVDHRTRQRALLSLAEALFNVVLTWILVVALGTVGAAVATLATYLLSMLGMIALARAGGSLLPRASI